MSEPLMQTSMRGNNLGRARRPRILLAEDNEDMRALLSQALRANGYDVVELPNGTLLEMRLTSEARKGFDAVISDIRMPGVSGLDVLAQLRKFPDAPPMILITAFGDRETHGLAQRLGVAAMFDKPFDIDALLTELRRVAPLGTGDA
ncbi:MAG: response regulator [Phycisphaerales bacterium]|nr:response regulator [Phycisphaerales bacterium]